MCISELDMQLPISPPTTPNKISLREPSKIQEIVNSDTYSLTSNEEFSKYQSPQFTTCQSQEMKISNTRSPNNSLMKKRGKYKSNSSNELYTCSNVEQNVMSSNRKRSRILVIGRGGDFDFDSSNITIKKKPNRNMEKEVRNLSSLFHSATLGN